MDKEFIFGIPQNYDNAVTNITLDIASTSPGYINVSVPDLHIVDVNYSINRSTSVPLPTNVVIGGSYKGHKSVHVRADIDISLAVTSYRPGSIGTFLVLPVHQLGTDYVAASWSPLTQYSSEIMVVAVHDNTTVTITQYGIALHAAFSLSKLELAQFQNTYDITTAEIQCSQPCAVISGSSCSRINPSACDVILEFLLPVTDWGHTYVIPSIKPYPEYFTRILTQNNTNIDVVNVYNDHNITYAVKWDSIYTARFGDKYLMLVSQHRFGIFIYASIFVNQSEGDPFMTLIPAVSQYLSRYDFTVPEIPGYSHYVSVTVPTDELSNLYLDGVKVTDYTSVYHGNVSSFSVYNVKIESGYHVLLHSDPKVKFGAILFGHGRASGYGRPAGLNPKGSRCHEEVGTNPSTAQETATTRTSAIDSTTKPAYTVRGITPTYSETTSLKTHTVKASPTPTSANVALPKRSTTSYSPPGTLSVASTISSITSSAASVMRSEAPTGVPQECYSCDDMSNPVYCDTVATCPAGQRCMKESRGSHATGADGCVECCTGPYCNNRGCGGSGLPARKDRGPVCFDCQHVGSPTECSTVALCSKSQICGVYEYHWGENLHYKIGCASHLCAPVARSARHVIEARSIPVCRKCCNDDFCNRNCTQAINTGGLLVG